MMRINDKHAAGRPDAQDHLRSTLGDSGAVAVEFAIIFPVLLIMFFGMIELFLYYTAYVNVVRVAQTLSDVVSRQTSINRSTISSFFAASSTIMSPTPTTGLVMTIASVVPPELLPTVAWSCKGTPSAITGPGTGTFAPGSLYLWPSAASTTVTLSGGITRPVTMLSYNTSVVVTDVTYTYTSPLGKILPNPISIDYKTFATPRVAAKIAAPNPSC